MIRFGFGYDIHRLVMGRRLIIGGVLIPFDKGLFGHSDADVLIHAICDAILGSIGEGDIGRHFPDTDPAYRDISSLILLERVNAIALSKGYVVNNIDATVVAQQPKIADYIPDMVKNISDKLMVDKGYINIKATTNEGLDSTGREEGIAAYSVVSLKRV